MKKWILSTVIFFMFTSDIIYAQVMQEEMPPYLTINYRRNILGQKIDIYDGPQRLDREQVIMMMQRDPDALNIYRRALVNKRWQTIMDVTAGATAVGSIYYIISPRFQSIAPNNLFLPITIANVVTGLASGYFRRQNRNLTRQAVDVYNFGSELNPSNNYNQNNTYNFPGMTFRAYF